MMTSQQRTVLAWEDKPTECRCYAHGLSVRVWPSADGVHWNWCVKGKFGSAERETMIQGYEVTADDAKAAAGKWVIWYARNKVGRA